MWLDRGVLQPSRGMQHNGSGMVNSVDHSLHTAEVTGAIPVVPTVRKRWPAWSWSLLANSGVKRLDLASDTT